MNMRTDRQVASDPRKSQTRNWRRLLSRPVWIDVNEGLKLVFLTAATTTLLATLALVMGAGAGQ